MENKTSDINAGLASGDPHAPVKSELTDERLGHETPETKQDPTPCVIVKEEDAFEEKSGVELPPFGVDIPYPESNQETQGEVLNNAAAVQKVAVASGIVGVNPQMPSQYPPGIVPSNLEGAGASWRAHVSRDERAQQIAVLYNLLKQKYAKNLDSKMKDQFVILAQRVENAWFHKAEGKVCWYIAEKRQTEMSDECTVTIHGMPVQDQYLSKSALIENFSKIKRPVKRSRDESSSSQHTRPVSEQPQLVTTVPMMNPSVVSGHPPATGQYGMQQIPGNSGLYVFQNQVEQQNMYPPRPYRGAHPQENVYHMGVGIPNQYQMPISNPGVPQNTGLHHSTVYSSLPATNTSQQLVGQYMSNGAPVLLRGSSNTAVTQAPQPLGLTSSNNGMNLTSQNLYIPQQRTEQQMIPVQTNRISQMIPVESEKGSEYTQKGLDDILNTSGGQSSQDPEVRKAQIIKQQRWLLFLRHCAKCTLPPGECQYKDTCALAKELWSHLITCKDENCKYPRCHPSRTLLQHHQRCRSSKCPVCAPVKRFVTAQREAIRAKKLAESGLTEQQQQYQLQQMRIRRAQLAERNSIRAQYGSTNDLSNPVIDTERRAQLLSNDNMGTSLTEYFTVEELEKHIAMLTLSEAVNKQPAASKKSSSSALDGMMPLVEEESQCKLCNHNRLLFEPQALYCYCCGIKIKRNQSYYASPPSCDVRATWCHSCHANAGKNLMLDSFTIAKQDLEKKKNDIVSEEPWVQCDICESWVHQICGLFNKGNNDDSRGFICPECLLSALKTGKRKVPDTRPQAMLTAKELPKSRLSDVLEERLNSALQQEKAMRAKERGVDVSQVEDYPELIVRVVNNVEKKVEVTARFAKEFCTNGRADAYLYKQKVIVVFQNIDGVDMCLYCLYVQEYGDNCPAPNNRTVYLSYLDSVKYFRPESVAASGMGVAMRTYIYHEVLIGYLEDVKRRGFCAMYIWACPPLAGDDYIFYCHPGRQKVPRSDRLREWYLTMLRRSEEENTVVYISNMVDTFFDGGKDHRIEQPSVTDLPYLAGDYWPGEAEKYLAQDDPLDPSGNGRTKKKEKRLKVPEGAGLGQVILAKLAEYSDMNKMKADFIVAHLYESCSHCRVYINGANRYYHPDPPQKATLKNENVFDGISLDKPGNSASKPVTMTRFQLCQTCYEREQGKLDMTPLGLPQGIELKDLIEEACPIIPPNIDEDPDMDSEFFDTRQQFLSLCQGNHYQFDTLRRARHSSMMSLYHLHNPAKPAFSASCNICQAEVPPGEGYRCSKCPDFDMCRRCHSNPNVSHPHPLTAPDQKKFDETQMRLSRGEKKRREAQMKMLMQLVVHAATCDNMECQDVNCAKLKNLYRHFKECQVGPNRGCGHCRKILMYINMHSKLCTKSNCPVPHCGKIRAIRRDHAARQEAKRREAYRRMMEKQQQSSSSATGQK